MGAYEYLAAERADVVDVYSLPGSACHCDPCRHVGGHANYGEHATQTPLPKGAFNETLERRR